MILDLDALQNDYTRWLDRNFPQSNELSVYGGLAEEVGEVLRAAVKRDQGIRGTQEQWTVELRKELGDVLIKVLDACRHEGWLASEVLAERWSVIRERDWQANPDTGAAA